MALGHVHARLDVGSNGAYAGSTEHTSSDIWRGANENKGFLSVDLPSGKRVFHELTSPRELVVMEPIDGAHLTATEVSLRIVKDLDAIPGGLEGKIVRLPLLNISRELMRALDHRAIRLMRAKALNLTIDVRPPKREEGESYIAPKVRRSLSDELKSFAQQWPGRSLRTEQVVQTVERLVKQLEEQHEARPA
jgi:DNA repair exonuclease SbcCD nuclease subunit